MHAKRPSSDALKIMDKLFYEGRPERMADLEKARSEDSIARKVYDLRIEAGLTQAQLAKMVGTSASVISRLEDAEYEGHSLSMLNRIAAALNRRVEIRFMPLQSKKTKTSQVAPRSR